MKAAVFIDGGHLRVLVRQAGYRYDPDYIEAVSHVCVAGEETLLRILYYDCAPYQGNPKLPVSGKPAAFQGSDEWLKGLAAKSLFAVRLGTLKFRRSEPNRVPIASAALSDDDFRPRFEQKGVDMRLGFDSAAYAADRSVERVILVTGDTDCLPVTKRARTNTECARRRWQTIWSLCAMRCVRDNPASPHGTPGSWPASRQSGGADRGDAGNG